MAMERHTQLAALLRRCNSLSQGKKLYASIIDEQGGDPSIFTANLIMQMYGRCGGISEASALFDELGKKNRRNVFSWTIMVTAFAQNGHLQEAKETFRSMPQRSVISWNAMISSYAQFGHLIEARSLFNRMPQRSLSSWNAIVSAYAQNEHFEEAWELFRFMDLEGIRPDRITFVSVCTACTSLLQAKRVQMKVYESGLESDAAVGGALVSNFSRCRAVDDAQDAFNRIIDPDVVAWTSILAAYALNGHLQQATALFERMPVRDEVSWTAMISSHTQFGHPKEALILFRRMDLEGIEPDEVAFSAAINSCEDLEELATIHRNVISSKIEDGVLENSLVNMYGKCGRVEQAKLVFDTMKSRRSVVTWTALLAAFAQNGHPQEARRVFELIPLRNIVSWNSIFTAAESEEQEEEEQGTRTAAVELYSRMLQEGIRPDRITLICLLDAAAALTNPVLGSSLHAQAEEAGLQSDPMVTTALLNMYFKSGCLDQPQRLFSSVPPDRQDVVLWSALLGGYAQNGDAIRALDIFHSMQLHGVQPNEITFISVLSACSHLGLVDRGWEYLVSMSTDYQLDPSSEHYICMVDLLGRSGRVADAESVIMIREQKEQEDQAMAWKSLLSSCNGDVDRAARIWELVLQLDPADGSSNVMLSNILAAAGDS